MSNTLPDLIVKKIYQRKKTKDNLSFYTTIVLHKWDDKDDEYVLHLREDKVNSNTVFIIGEVWSNLHLARKSLKHNTLNQEDFKVENKKKTNNYILIGRRTENKKEEVSIYSSEDNRCDVVTIIKKQDVETYIVIQEDLISRITNFENLTKEEIFKKFAIIHL